MSTPCPSILISSCCNQLESKYLVKEILNVSELPAGRSAVEEILSYDWEIDNKYYTATVQLCIAPQKTIGNKEFADSVQAIVLLFDPDEEGSFDNVKLWQSFLKELNPAICLLVCDCSKDQDKIPRTKVLHWCIENSFELIELNPEDDTLEDEDDDFMDTVGLPRIIQALQAHPWQNLNMKEPTNNYHNPYMKSILAGEIEKQLKCREKENKKSKKSQKEKKNKKSKNRDSESDEDSDTSWNAYQQFGESNFSDDDDNAPADDADTSGTDSSSSSSLCSSRSNSPVTIGGASGGNEATATAINVKCGDGIKNEISKDSDDSDLEGLLNDGDKAMFEALNKDDPNGESFEKLLQNFKFMKEKAESMNHEDRQKYAERMATSLWLAVDSAADELSDPVNSGDDI